VNECGILQNLNDAASSSNCACHNEQHAPA
jgi:hypothetical protein